MNEVVKQKKLFLDAYNFDRSKDIGLTKAINAAVQHNNLYAREATANDRKIIREFWKQNLLEIGDEFKNSINIDTYEFMISKLASGMNNKFEKLFDNGNPHGSMFRISHSQKSISVFVKHLWCLDLIPEPNICPVDRIILSQTDAKKNKDLSWGYVNTIEDHRRKFNYLLKAASETNMTLAQWELSKFKSE